MERGVKFAAVGIAVAMTAGAVAYAAAPKETERILSTTVIHVGDALPGLKDTPPSTTASTHEVAIGCIDISQVASATKLGTLVLPMAATSELDQLASTLVSNNISSFALLGSALEDNVTYSNQQMPLAYATKSIIQLVYENTGTKVTFALDEEGGKVQRTKQLDKGIHALPSPQDQSVLGSTQIDTIFKNHGNYLATLGVTTVFGPLTDVGTHGADGNRSYSDDPNVMAMSAGAAIDGLHAAGIQATAKHLPDNGQDQNNTDDQSGIVPDIQILQKTTLPAITSVLRNNHPEYGMVGNYIVPGLTNNMPASLTPATYSFIRSQMGYNGVLITDALNAKSIQNFNSAPDLIISQALASVQALEAGADVVIISLDASNAVMGAIGSALKAGQLTQVRINEAATAALRAKGYAIC